MYRSIFLRRYTIIVSILNNRVKHINIITNAPLGNRNNSIIIAVININTIYWVPTAKGIKETNCEIKISSICIQCVCKHR